MMRKIATLFTLMVFMVFMFSCYSVRRERIETIKQDESSVKILALLKKSGERLEFLKDNPGRIIEKKIIGKVLDEENKEISISVPISEVDSVWIKKFSMGKTLLFVVGGTAIASMGLVVIALATKESCPFIYSFDGEKYVFDAEPYGGAICPGLQRTDWCGLQYLKEVDGEYRLLITNEVNETQYTDELKLLVVDHPGACQVIPDPWGGIHTVSDPIVPVGAYDQGGRDITSYVCENDWVFWQSRNEEKNPRQKEDLRDELIFEFPKPQLASKAKLVFNGCSSLWGSHMLRLYLGLYGEQVSKWYQEVKNLGPALFEASNTLLREELYSLHVRVETKNGWQSKGMIRGGGPFVSEDMVYLLDLEDVPGNTLKIKLTPPAAFWMINYIAVDYTEDLPVKTTEIQAIKAIDHDGRDVREILAKTDNNYLKMPNIGDTTELIFQAPPANANLERSVILKAGGYYDIHLKAEGEPQTDILERIHSEPGFVVQYALKEYLHWKQENMKK